LPLRAMRGQFCRRLGMASLRHMAPMNNPMKSANVPIACPPTTRPFLMMTLR